MDPQHPVGVWTGDAANASAVRVVVAHSNDRLRDEVVSGLSGRGWPVLPLDTAESAWSVLSRTSHPTMVVVEIGLPALGGLSLCHDLRERRGVQVWIVLEATGAMPKQIAEGVRAGADDFAHGAADAVERIVSGERPFRIERQLEILAARAEAQRHAAPTPR